MMPSLYGHFGQGCVHTRIPFDLYSAEGVAKYRRFMERAADLVVSTAARCPASTATASPAASCSSGCSATIVHAFGELKAVFDPGDKMNPGKVVHPAPLDGHLRLGGDWAPATPQDLYFRFPDDGGSFAQAANRCVGVGKCRQHDIRRCGDVPVLPGDAWKRSTPPAGGPGCCSRCSTATATRRSDGWRSESVRDALDLCLACKGCKKDCPANVDMATYKAEFLAHHWKGRQWQRPRADFSLGWLPTGRARRARLRRRRCQRGDAHARPASRRQPARRRRRPRVPALRPPGPAALARSAAGRAVTGAAAPSCCGPTRSPTTFTRASARPPSKCSRTPAGGCRSRPSGCAAG